MPSQASSFFFRKFSVSSSDCSTHFHASPHWALISEGIGISLPGNSDSLAVLSIFMAAVVVENVTTVVITFLRISPLFLPHTQKQDTGKTDIPFLMIFFISCKGSSSYLAWIRESLWMSFRFPSTKRSVLCLRRTSMKPSVWRPAWKNVWLWERRDRTWWSRWLLRIKSILKKIKIMLAFSEKLV